MIDSDFLILLVGGIIEFIVGLVLITPCFKNRGANNSSLPMLICGFNCIFCGVFFIIPWTLQSFDIFLITQENKLFVLGFAVLIPLSVWGISVLYIKNKLRLEKCENIETQEIEAWAKVRKKGMLNFILMKGVLLLGALSYFIMTILPVLRGNNKHAYLYFIWQAFLWAATGALLGAIFWYLSEIQYIRKLKRKQ